MIELLEYPHEPLLPGQAFELRVVATEPVSVEVRCFVKEPPPPGYRPCAECGSFRVPSSGLLDLRASPALFARRGGVLELNVSDGDGDERTIQLQVKGRGEAHGSSATQVAFS